jgi:hypothetical protein
VHGLHAHSSIDEKRYHQKSHCGKHRSGIFFDYDKED